MLIPPFADGAAAAFWSPRLPQGGPPESLRSPGGSERPDHVFVTVLRGKHQGRPAIVVPGFYIRARREQGARDLVMAVARRFH